MLLQSHMGEIHLLPACPAAWPQGEVRGLRARGGFDVSFSWHDGRVVKGTLRSLVGETCTLRSAQPLSVKGAKVLVRRDGDYYLYTFATRAGARYGIVPENK